jgi:DNA-binding response OmpR family regulator
MLPRGSGLDVCEAIRALPEQAGIRIVMVSAKGRDDDVDRAYRAGVDRYFVKPVVTRVLIRHVRELAGDRPIGGAPGTDRSGSGPAD